MTLQTKPMKMNLFTKTPTLSTWLQLGMLNTENKFTEKYPRIAQR